MSGARSDATARSDKTCFVLHYKQVSTSCDIRYSCKFNFQSTELNSVDDISNICDVTMNGEANEQRHRDKIVLNQIFHPLWSCGLNRTRRSACVTAHVCAREVRDISWCSSGERAMSDEAIITWLLGRYTPELVSLLRLEMMLLYSLFLASSALLFIICPFRRRYLYTGTTSTICLLQEALDSLIKSSLVPPKFCYENLYMQSVCQLNT